MQMRVDVTRVEYGQTPALQMTQLIADMVLRQRRFAGSDHGDHADDPCTERAQAGTTTQAAQKRLSGPSCSHAEQGGWNEG